jgi:hypothetical protein
MSEILPATTNDLLDIAASGETGHWQIAVWPGPSGVLASDADVVATTKAAVLWQTLRGVRTNGNQLTVITDAGMYRSVGDATFVIREAS